MIILPGIIDGIKTRKDGGITIVFGTQELSPQQGAELFELRGGYAYMGLQRDEFTSFEIPEKSKINLPRKTPAQRLRWEIELYRRHINSELGEEEFYNLQMDKLINFYNSKIE